MSDHKPIKVERAQYADVPKIQQMIQDAFDHDPLYKYLRKTPDADSKHPDSAFRRFIVYLDILYHVHYLGAFTINHGDGCVTFARPNPGTTARVVQCVFVLLAVVVFWFTDTPEQAKRWEELMDKLAAATRQAFGADIDRMLRVRELAAAPEHQGKGYGSALMATANREADKLGCASWLLSSNVANTQFYERWGYVIVKELIIGENNPTWRKPPFSVLIMAHKSLTQVQSGFTKGF